MSRAGKSQPSAAAVPAASPETAQTGKGGVKLTRAEREREIARLEKKMKEAAKLMEFEYAAVLRDEIIRLRGEAADAKK